MPMLHVSCRSLACALLAACTAGAVSSSVQAEEAATGKSGSQVKPAPVESTVTSGRASHRDASSTKSTTAVRPEKHVIGAVAFIVEPQSQLAFRARVDTGAASCSIHCEQWEIENEAENMEENIGKPIRVLIGNHNDEPEWIESQIDRCVTVKTSERKEVRYKIPLTFRWKDFEKQVVVTLNNRGHMNYPVLLGRNFLEGDFLVDIEQKHDHSEEIAQVK